MGETTSKKMFTSHNNHNQLQCNLHAKSSVDKQKLQYD